MGGFAWVTLATNDAYSLGALVLAHSLRRVGTKHDLAVLVTPGVTGAMREKLSSVFSLVQEVNVLDSKDEANLALLARPELGITFTKLHCWRLTQYDKCVFVDADTLVIKNCDELFDREELAAAPDVGWPDCFNSGVFVFKPSQQTFASITSFAAARGSFDGGDQGLLNQYFSDWAHKDISKHLPFIYNMCSTATYSYLPAFKQFGDDVRIIHFIGVTKPWLQYFDTLTGQVQMASGTNHLQPLLQLWWNIFCENVHPQLSPVMASSTLTRLWHEYKSNSSISNYPNTLSNYPDDLTHENVEPDFSEFQDPWENYVEEMKIVPIIALNEPKKINDNDNHNNSKNNNTREWIEKNDFQPSTSFQSNNDQSNSQNHRSDYHENENFSSVLEKRENNNEKRDNDELYHEKTFDDRDFIDEKYYFFIDNENENKIDNEICDSCRRNDDKNDTNNDKLTESMKQHHDDKFAINRQINENSHHDEDNQRNYHHHHHHRHHRENEPRHDENEVITCDRVLSKISNDNIDENARERINEDNRLTDQCIIDFHNERTDEFVTVSHSHPAPCTKSKSITTQSESNITRQLEINDAGIAGALAKITLGEARSPEQVAFEEHMRKHSWEQGQIDYMGRDSFDNIWKKISETLAVQPEREPSPSKTVTQREKSKIEEAPVVTAEDEPATESEPAMISESQQGQYLIREFAHDVRKLIPSLSELTPEQISEKTVSSPSSTSDAALSTVAPVSTVSQLSTLESIVSATTATDSSITKSEISAAIVSKIGETLESQKDMKTESIRLSETVASAEILSGTHVPVQVAVSVLEAGVKESVIEDIRPVTEEAISSISMMARESVPAVMETAIEAAEPINPTITNGSASSEIGNGIDALSLSSSTRVTSVAKIEGPLDIVTSVQTEESPISTSPQETRNIEKEETSSLSTEPVQEILEIILPAETQEKLEVETQQSSVATAEKSEDPKSSTETKEKSTFPVELTEKLQETQLSSSPVELSEKSEEVGAPKKTEELSPVLVVAAEKLEDLKSFTETTENRPIPVESTEKHHEVKPSTESLQSSSHPVESMKKLPESKISAETQENIKILTCKFPEKPDLSDSSTKIEKPVLCPIKPLRKVEIPIVATKTDNSSIPLDPSIKKPEVLKETTTGIEANEEISELSDESPMRPSRTKEMQIPGTPTITEATPPTSPPIGGVESLEAEQAATKVTKKIVKKVVKKTASTESTDIDAEGKKVTKKIVKKVAKKKDDEGNGDEGTSGTEKPKKIVKIVKKTTKTSTSLDAEASVPETPPPGTSEMPVPPKRKLKTTPKTTIQKTDPEP